MVWSFATIKNPGNLQGQKIKQEEPAPKTNNSAPKTKSNKESKQTIPGFTNQSFSPFYKKGGNSAPP